MCAEAKLPSGAAEERRPGLISARTSRSAGRGSAARHQQGSPLSFPPGHSFIQMFTPSIHPSFMHFGGHFFKIEQQQKV